MVFVALVHSNNKKGLPGYPQLKKGEADAVPRQMKAVALSPELDAVLAEHAMGWSSLGWTGFWHIRRRWQVAGA